MKYALADGVAIEDTGGVAVLTTAVGDAAILNGTAHAVLDLLLNDPSAVVERMTAEYDVSGSVVAADAEEVVEKLVGWGLLRKLPG